MANDTDTDVMNRGYESKEEAQLALRRAAAEGDRTKRSLLRLARKDLVEPRWDEEDGCYRWGLSEFAVEMYEEVGRDGVRTFIEAADSPGESVPPAMRVFDDAE